MAPLSSPTTGLINSDLNLTFYYNNCISSMLAFRQFAALALTQVLVHKQVFKELYLREYPV